MGAATWILPDVIYQGFPVRATSSRCTEPCPRPQHPTTALGMGTTADDEAKKARQPQPQPLFASAGHEPARVFNGLSFSPSSLSSASPSPIIHRLKILFSLKSQHVHYLSITQQVKMLKFLTLTFLAACAIPLALADGPTRTFIARAYQSPYPIGQQLSGTYLSASGGSLWVTTVEPAEKAQLNVDSAGKAYLVRDLLHSFPFFSLTP